MDSDCHFVTGHTHRVCQDYAMTSHSSDGSYGLAVLSDGCSSAPFTDFGSRAVCMCAMRYLAANRTSAFELPPDTLARIILEKAATAPHIVSIDSLHATLLTAVIDTAHKRARAMIFGDGAVAVHSFGKLRQIVYVDYEKNAPCYPLYLVRDTERMNYLRMSEGLRRTVVTVDFDDKGEAEASAACTPRDEPTSIVLNETDGLTLTLLSDGVDLFRNADTQIRPWMDVVREAVAFKSTVGEYVVRRMRAMLKKLADEQGVHEDDFAVASITA